MLGQALEHQWEGDLWSQATCTWILLFKKKKKKICFIDFLGRVERQRERGNGGPKYLLDLVVLFSIFINDWEQGVHILLITLLAGTKLRGAADIFENREITQMVLKRLGKWIEITTMRFDLGKMQMKAAGREIIQMQNNQWAGKPRKQPHKHVWQESNGEKISSDYHYLRPKGWWQVQEERAWQGIALQHL